MGVYNHEDNKIYLSPGLLYERDPKKIAEVLFHENGHPLLNDEFGIDHQISADFLAIYSVGSCDIFEGRKEKSMQEYNFFKEVIMEMLGDNKQFLKENKKLIKDTKEDWYPKIKEELVTIFNTDPDKLTIKENVRNLLDDLYPEYREIIKDYEEDDNPVRNFNRVRMFETINYMFTTPVKELSGCVLGIPHELAERIEERTGIFVGRGCYMTPKNNIPYSLEEIIEKGMRFELKHPLFK